LHIQVSKTYDNKYIENNVTCTHLLKKKTLANTYT